MPFVPVAHLFSVTQTLAQPNGDIALNVFHGRRNAGSIDDTTAQLVMAGVNGAWTAHLQSWVSNQCSLQTYSVRDLSVVGGRTYYRGASSGVGGATATILPEQLAVCTTLNRGSGPSQRGRVYNAGFCTNALDVASGHPIVKGTTIADIDLWIEDMAAAFSDHGCTWVVYSRKLAATTDVDVTRTPTDQRWDVQRRRANHRPVI